MRAVERLVLTCARTIEAMSPEFQHRLHRLAGHIGLPMLLGLPLSLLFAGLELILEAETALGPLRDDKNTILRCQWRV